MLAACKRLQMMDAPCGSPLTCDGGGDGGGGIVAVDVDGRLALSDVDTMD